MDFYGTIDDETSFGSYFQLTVKQRFYGFLAATITGLSCNILGLLMLFLTKYVSFAVLYSLGNVCLILSLMFIIGPMRQIKGMFSEYRYITSTVFILSIIAAFIVSFVLHKAVLSLICAIIQTCAFVWYVLSYIPFGRTLCWGCIKTTTSSIV